MTDDRRQEIIDQFEGGTQKVFARVRYEDDDGVWRTIPDVSENGITTTKDTTINKYSSVNLTPKCSTCSFTVLNKDFEYSEGSGSTKEGVLRAERKVELWFGVGLPTYGDEYETDGVRISDAFCFFTKYEDGALVLDKTNSSGNADDYFQSIFDTLYDSGLYDASTYTKTGYAVCTFDSVEEGKYGLYALSASVTANTTNITILYRFVDLESDTGAWTEWGASSNGTSTISIEQLFEKRYLQIAFVFASPRWSALDAISAVTLTVKSKVEWIKDGTFYLDEPDYKEPAVNVMPTVSCTGRDAWKQAIESEYNIPAYTAVYYDTIIKSLCDIFAIPYTSESIADLSSFGAVTLTAGYTTTVTLDTILNDIMEIIGPDYLMWIDKDGYLHCELKPTSYQCDHVFDYRFYKEAIKTKLTDIQLKKVSLDSSEESLLAEELLGEDNYTAAGQYTISWSGEATAKRYEFSFVSGESDYIHFYLDSWTVESGTFTIQQTVGSDAFEVNVKVYGCKYASTVPDASAQATSTTNTESNSGCSVTLINPLVDSNATATRIVEALLAAREEVQYQVIINFNLLFPLSDINEQALLLSRALFDNNIYLITGISQTYDGSASARTTITLTDTGKNFSDNGSPSYDMNGLTEGEGDIMYDSGIIYDIDIFGNNKDTIDYSDMEDLYFSESA